MEIILPWYLTWHLTVLRKYLASKFGNAMLSMKQQLHVDLLSQNEFKSIHSLLERKQNVFTNCNTLHLQLHLYISFNYLIFFLHLI